MKLPLFVILITLSTFAWSNAWNKKTISDEWTWVEDYVFFSAEYVVECEPSKKCEIGTGIFVFNEPRGNIERFTGRKEISVYGFGSIHIRAIETKKVKIAIILNNKKLLSTPTLTW